MSSAATHDERAVRFQERRQAAEGLQEARNERRREFLRKRAEARGESPDRARLLSNGTPRREDVLAFQRQERGVEIPWPAGAWEKVGGRYQLLRTLRHVLDAVDRHLRPRREGEQRCAFDGAVLLELRPPGKAGRKAVPRLVCPKCRGNGVPRVAGEIQRVIDAMVGEVKRAAKPKKAKA